MATIGWREALLRTAVVVIGEVLLVLVIAGVLGAVGVAPTTASLSVAVVSTFAVVLGLFAVLWWALVPWLAGRVQRRIWAGKEKLDQAEILRRRRMS